MMVEIEPETERLVQQELRSGHFRSVDELIKEALNAWREKYRIEQPATAVSPRKPRKNLADFLTESPFAGSELNLERQKDYPRPIDL